MRTNTAPAVAGTFKRSLARERDIESRLVRYCRPRGVLCYKFTSPANRGVPDRILIVPGGKVGFLELKRPGQVPTALQEHVLKTLELQGCRTGWADSFETAARFVALLVRT